MAAVEFTNLEQSIIGLQTEIAQTMRKRGFVPVDTGRLRRSIKTLPVVDTPKGIVAPIQYAGYGIFPDLGTKFQPAQRFTERAEKQALAKQQEAVAEAAAQDIANSLEQILPDNVTVTI